jgi:hypothetical protein
MRTGMRTGMRNVLFILVVTALVVGGLFWYTTRRVAPVPEAVAPAPAPDGAAPPDTTKVDESTGWTPADTTQGGP